jgi:ferredoxin-NADP reductase
MDPAIPTTAPTTFSLATLAPTTILSSIPTMSPPPEHPMQQQIYYNRMMIDISTVLYFIAIASLIWLYWIFGYRQVSGIKQIQSLMNLRCRCSSTCSCFSRKKSYIFVNTYFMFAAFCCILFLTNIFIIILSSGFHSLYLKSTGTMLAANMTFNVMISMKNFWSKEINIISIHKFMGFLITMLSILHTLCYLFNLSPPNIQIFEFTTATLFTPLPRLWGWCALFSLVVLLIFVLPCVREKKYIWFHNVHIMATIAFFIFTALHRPFFIPWAILGGISICADYWWRWYYFKTEHVGVIKKYSDRYIMLTVNFDMHDQVYSQCCYMYVYIPSISILSSHPFSVINKNRRTIEFCIKVERNFTKKLLAINDEVSVRLSKVFPSLSLDYTNSTELILIANGIGITPIINILHRIFSTTTHKIQYVILVWFCKSFELVEIFGSHINNFLEKKLVHLLPIVCLKTPPPLSMLHMEMFSKIDIEFLFSTILGLEFNEVGDTPESDRDEKVDELDEVEERRNIDIIACGTDHLIDDVWDNVNKYSNSKINITLNTVYS